MRAEPSCPALPCRHKPTRPAPGASLRSRNGASLREQLPQRAEVRHFVLISLSKPMKRKFPHGKPLVFACARMCWKASQWKIPKQPPANVVKPLVREHLGAVPVPALLNRWKSWGCSELGLRALHRPGAGVVGGDSLRGWGTAAPALLLFSR